MKKKTRFPRFDRPPIGWWRTPIVGNKSSIYAPTILVNEFSPKYCPQKKRRERGTNCSPFWPKHFRDQMMWEPPKGKGVNSRPIPVSRIVPLGGNPLKVTSSKGHKILPQRKTLAPSSTIRVDQPKQQNLSRETQSPLKWGRH